MDTGITDIQIQKVISDNQELSACGWDKDPRYPFTPAEYHMIRICADWIQKNTTKTKSIRYDITSYGYKHIVERAAGEYIINGSFIIAALLLGFKFKKHGGINCCFNMKLNPDVRKRVRGY